MKDEKITWSERAIETIATLMMREPRPERFRSATLEQKAAFLQRNRHIIEAVWPYVPRGFSAVGAACCKCAVVYGVEPVIEFLQNFKTMLFKGRADPVCVYRMWFDSKRRQPRNRTQTYEMTAIACKAYCEKRTITGLESGKGGPKDVFDWDENWEYNPKKLKYKPPIVPTAIEVKQVYSVDEVAALLGTSASSIKRGCQMGVIKAEKGPGHGKWSITQEQVDHLKQVIAQGEVERLKAKQRKQIQPLVLENKSAYSVDEAASMLGVSASTIREGCNHGRIQATKVFDGHPVGKWMVPQEQIDKLKIDAPWRKGPLLVT